MLLERLEAPGLAHYSYIIGCPGSGTMAVVDPERNVDRYLRFAEQHRLRISHVLETHIHADYASGARELAERAGAECCVSAYDAGETFEVRFAHRDLEDGDSIAFGAVKIVALHTPGHTPEHLSFLVYDLARCDRVPQLMLTGDFLFVGSLGRPDLLGEDQKRALAKAMFRTVREKLAALPDGLEVYPAHGAGSMCGSGMSGRPHSTLGYERIANPYLNPSLNEAQFVNQLLGTVPPFPPYYRRMKRVNSEGHALPLGATTPPPLNVAEFAKRMARGAVVIDLRDQLAFGGGHIPGSIGIGIGTNLPVWASWVVPYDVPLLLVASGHQDEAAAAATMLVRVGFDTVEGHLEGGIPAWLSAGRDLAELRQISPAALQAELASNSDLNVIDVRSDSEWAGGHIAGALHLFGGTLADHLDELPERERRLTLVCGGGYRSTVLGSVLQRAGFTSVESMTGGMGAWQRAALPVVRPSVEDAGVAV